MAVQKSTDSSSLAKETKVYCGDSKPTPSKGDILWRGKLNEVDGFFLGKIFDSKQ